jgi:hypothetical protein
LSLSKAQGLKPVGEPDFILYLHTDPQTIDSVEYKPQEVSQDFTDWPQIDYCTFDKAILLEGYSNETKGFTKRSTKSVKSEVSMMPSKTLEGGIKELLLTVVMDKAVADGYFAYHIEDNGNLSEEYAERKYYLSSKSLKNPRPDNVDYIMFVRYRMDSTTLNIADNPYWISIIDWPERTEGIVLFLSPSSKTSSKTKKGNK